MKRVIIVLTLALVGCATPPRPSAGTVGNEADRLMARKDYPAALAANPEFVGDALTTVVELQRRIHQSQP